MAPMNARLSVAAGCAVALGALAAETAPDATATFVDVNGKSIGEARLVQTPAGVLIEAQLSGLPPGEHALHIHLAGQCDADTKFKSAGEHFTGGKHRHGYLVEQGPHAGDLPNQFVARDGTLRVEVFTPLARLSGGKTPVLDGDGAALVIHGAPDDYRSQPSGAAGERIACAVIEAAKSTADGSKSPGSR